MKIAKMSHYILKFVLFSITVIAIYSCGSLRKIAIQVPIPPKYTISPEIQSIAILNRSMTRDFINLKQGSIEKTVDMDNPRYKKTFFDSIAADTAIKVAANAIFDSKRFDVVIPTNLNIMRNDNNSILEPLDSTFIIKLCEDFNVDGILVLENFSEMVNIRIHLSHWEYIGNIKLTYNSAWRFYQPSQNPFGLSFVVSDDIYWETPDCDCLSSLKIMYKFLPTIKEALIGGGLALGLDISDRFSPGMKDVSRSYYITRNKKIDEAIPLIKDNKWDEASKIWLQYSSVSSKSLRSKIQHNLALAAEMTDDINGAIEWGLKSFKTKYSRTTELYLDELGRRRSILENAPKSL